MLWVAPCEGRVLQVGAARVLKVPSQAATVAMPGDVVRIDPGTYADCAVWRAPRLVIEAAGPGVVLAGKVCAETATFIVLGNDTVISGLTFAGAAGAGHNAAAIKGLGVNLTVQDSRFVDNENGILAGGPRTSVVRITGSTFIGNGSCLGACAHAVYAGAPIFLLEVEGCVFRGTRTAHHIKSRAQNTVVRRSWISDGPEGTSSYLIETPNGGNLLVQDNILQKGPRSENPAAAISVGVEGVTNPTGAQIVQDNTFVNDLPGRTIFVRNSASAPVALDRNWLIGDVARLEAGPVR
jgi:hypothetical protein